jgi:hypothetical protein
MQIRCAYFSPLSHLFLLNLNVMRTTLHLVAVMHGLLGAKFGKFFGVARAAR